MSIHVHTAEYSWYIDIVWSSSFSREVEGIVRHKECLRDSKMGLLLVVHLGSLVFTEPLLLASNVFTQFVQSRYTQQVSFLVSVSILAVI